MAIAGMNGGKIQPYLEADETFISDGLFRTSALIGRCFLTDSSILLWPDGSRGPTAKVRLLTLASTEITKSGALGLCRLTLYTTNGESDVLETSKRLANQIAEVVSLAAVANQNIDRIIDESRAACRSAAGSEIVAEGEIGDAGLQAMAHLVVIRDAFHWAPVNSSGFTLLKMSFEHIVRAETSDNAIRFTCRDPENAKSVAAFPEMFKDNPDGESVAEFVLGDDRKLLYELTAGLRNFSPIFQEFRQQVDRF